MRLFLTIFSFIAASLVVGCSRKQENFLQSKNQGKVIGLLPLDDFDTAQLNYISKEIGQFYDREVVILNIIPIPSSFNLAKDDEFYSADSILNLLKKKVSGEIIEIVGLTHKNIGILKKQENSTGNPLFDYSWESVFGLGDFPGNCCVISNYKFGATGTNLLHRRLRTVVIHEMGHNLGLDHCSHGQCIMSEKNGNLFVLDNAGSNYCDDCKKKLQN